MAITRIYQVLLTEDEIRLILAFIANEEEVLEMASPKTLAKWSDNTKVMQGVKTKLSLCP